MADGKDHIGYRHEIRFARRTLIWNVVFAALPLVALVGVVAWGSALPFSGAKFALVGLFSGPLALFLAWRLVGSLRNWPALLRYRLVITPKEITFDDGQGTHRFAATDYVEIIPDSWLPKMRRGLGKFRLPAGFLLCPVARNDLTIAPEQLRAARWRADLGMVRFGDAVFLPYPFGGNRVTQDCVAAMLHQKGTSLQM